jgi:uncharacterized cysteine cluster protein YcgN (CxxCxxCC family)
MDETAYNNIQEEKLGAHEALCRRCGKCCGADTSEPCANLAEDNSGKFYCKSYEHRLGVQRTVSGLVFHCVNIREVLAKGIPHTDCGYSTYI